MLSKQFSLKRGILIAIEGIDGAGKTTQVRNIKDHFIKHGINVSTYKEPTDGIFGKKIRNLAIHGRHTVTPEEELELFIQDRIEDCEKNIRPSLLKNHLVIIDRYYFSNIAYQGALGIDQKYIKSRNEEIAIQPDLVIILDLAVHLGLSRIINNRKDTHNHFEKEGYLNKVRKIFNKMSMPFIQTIDASRKEYDVFSNIINILEDIISPHISIREDQTKLFSEKYDNYRAIKTIFN